MHLVHLEAQAKIHTQAHKIGYTNYPLYLALEAQNYDFVPLPSHNRF
jgi:hypothetical protein